MKKLPIGIQTFSEIREEEYLYVDKTKYIHELIKEGKIYFLSRPRRFGKSLLLSTIEELFKGSKELFEGLYIHDKWNWEEKYPIISLDISKVSKNLDDSLNDIVDGVAEDFNIELKRKTLNNRFAELIKKICEKTEQKVVVLIDEYDLPILDSLNNQKVLEANEKVLESFYRVLKTNDRYIKFIFITGISKFAHVSVFSTLNNTDDITLVDEYNSICGYTQKELENNFQDHIKRLSEKLKYNYEETLNKIKLYYDGYSWNGEEKIYNPYSTLLCFKHGRFSKSWFNTGTPNVLANYPLKQYTVKSIVEPFKVPDNDIENSTTEDITDEVLLFQTGYLTIENIESIGNTEFYELKIPNLEVETALFENLVKLYSKTPLYEMIEYGQRFLQYVMTGDCEGIKETIGDYLSPIPNTLRGRDERYYHALIFRCLLTSGLKVQSEVQTYNGNVDMIIEEKDHVVVVEFKQDNEKVIPTMLREAMKQIEEKEYTRPYKNKKIIKLALAFKGKEIGCKIEKNIQKTLF